MYGWWLVEKGWVGRRKKYAQVLKIGNVDVGDSHVDGRDAYWSTRSCSTFAAPYWNLLCLGITYDSVVVGQRGVEVSKGEDLTFRLLARITNPDP